METRYTVEESGDILRNVNIEIPREAFDKKYQDFLGKTARQVSIKGFRPGRVPRQVVAKRYGESIQNDVIWEFIQSALDKLMQESELKVVDLEKIDVQPLVEGQDIKAIASLSIFPEPVIENYKGLSLTVKEEVFKPESVEDELERLRTANAVIEAVEGRQNILDRDLVDISYKVEVEGKVIEDSEGETVQVMMGDLSYFQDLEEALKGRSIGEEFTFTHHYPEDNQNKDVAGKEGVFTVKVVSLKQRILPDLTDEFVAEKTAESTLEALRSRIEQDARNYVHQSNEAAREKAFFEALIERNSFSVPGKLIDEEIRSILSDSFGQKDTSKMDISKFRDHFSEQATFRVKSWIIVNQLLEQEKTELDDSAWDSWLLERATRLRRQRDELDSLLGLPGKEEHWKNVARRELAVSNAISTADFVVEKGGEKD